MNSTGENKRSETRLLHIGKATLGRKNMGRAERKSDYMDAFGQAIDIAIERKVDAVISAGRLFQSRSPSRSTVADLQSELQRLNTVDIPFYLVDGPKEAETDQTHLKSLARSGLILMDIST